MSSGGDGLAAECVTGEGHVLGEYRRRVVAHHQHVEVLVDRVDVSGRVGFVDEQDVASRTPYDVGACPPPAPSV